MFEELLERAKERAAKEERRAKRAAEDFTALLRSAKDLDPDAPWEDTKASLAKEPEYKAARAPPCLCCTLPWRLHSAWEPRCRPHSAVPHVATHTLRHLAFRVFA